MSCNGEKIVKDLSKITKLENLCRELHAQLSIERQNSAKLQEHVSSTCAKHDKYESLLKEYTTAFTRREEELVKMIKSQETTIQNYKITSDKSQLLLSEIQGNYKNILDISQKLQTENSKLTKESLEIAKENVKLKALLKKKLQK